MSAESRLFRIISEEFVRFYNWQIGIVIDDERRVKRSRVLVMKTELLLTGAESLREQGFKRSEQT